MVAFPVTRENLERALAEGSYGECVYLGKNDVADHQVVALEYRDGRTASFHAEGLSRIRFRETRLFGTGGEIWGDGRYIRIFDFVKGEGIVDLKVEAEGPSARGTGAGT